METNLNLEVIYGEFTNSELIEESVLLMRSLTHIQDQLAIIREIRRQRAPQDQEAIVLPLQRGSGEQLIKGEI